MIIKDQNFLHDTFSVDHGFFTRMGGVSDGIYKSLNCGPGSDDDAKSVHENRVCVSETFGLGDKNLVTMYQIHSAKCVFVKNQDQIPGECDAIVTDHPDIVLGVLTADCGPVLLYGQKPDGSPIVAAAHSGWGGAFKGVLANTVQMMVENGCDIETIRAGIGPCIGQGSYEVQNEFAEQFLTQDGSNEHFFKSATRDGHLMFDLSGYIAKRLAEAGVRHVSISGMDTYVDERRFFSYRRSTHRGEADYGRQISCITIKA